MNAKSEMTHCILQEIAIATRTQELDNLRGIQILSRTVFVEFMPVGVLDVIISVETNINIANLYVHFTGNASGGVLRVVFGGINAMVMASANINEMLFAKTPTNNIHWATLYGSEIQQTHYITQLLIAGGCKQEEIASVIFAKPEQKLKKD